MNTSTEREGGPLKRLEPITIKPEWQDPGDDKLEWFVYCDEIDGRVGIFTPSTMYFQPWSMVSSRCVERKTTSAQP